MEEENIQDQIAKTEKITGFGSGASQTFEEYQKGLKDMHLQTEQTEEEALSDARTKSFMSRAVGQDSILKKMVGLKLMNNGILDPSLAGYYLYRS